MEKHKKIPALRFPDFAEEWQLKKMGTLTERATNPVDVQDDELYSQIGIRSHGKGIFYKEAVTGKTLGNKRVFWVRENTFIVNIVFAWEQAVAKTTEKETGMIASHRFPMYSPVETQSDLDYLLQFFLTRKGKSLLELASPGGAGRNKTLGQKEFENLKFLVPNVAEQIKIASFITSIENKINQLKQKKNLLEQYKKGVMQGIFSTTSELGFIGLEDDRIYNEIQENENPTILKSNKSQFRQLRFKDENGKEFPEWEKKKVKEIFEITRGNVLSMKLVIETQDEKNLYPVYSSQTKNNGLSGYYEKFLFENCITWTTDGAGAGDVNYRKGKFYCTNVCGVLKNDKGYANFFVAELLNSVSRKHVSYVGNPKLMNNVMAEISIKLPTSIKEQTRISNFLTALDEKINLTENQIQKTQEYKKGLLQNMFC